MNNITPTENLLAKVPNELLETELFPTLGFRDLCHLKQMSKDLKNQVENSEAFKIFQSKYFPFGESDKTLKREAFAKIKKYCPLALISNIENFKDENFIQKLDFLMFANKVLKQATNNDEFFTDDIDQAKSSLEENKEKLKEILTLNLQNYGLQTLPTEMSYLKNLKILNISYNQLNDLPNPLFQINNLQIIRTNNPTLPFNQELNNKLFNENFSQGNYKATSLTNANTHHNVFLKKLKRTNKS